MSDNPDELLARMEATAEQAIDGFVDKGLTIAQFLDIEEEELEALYSLGHAKFVNDEYSDAVRIFALLGRLDPLSARNFKALGCALQMDKKYSKAIDAFGMALAVDLDDADASLNAGECLLLMGRQQEAKSALEGCIMQAKQNEKEFEETAKRASLLLEKMSTTDSA